jgi:hypothetical protein
MAAVLLALNREIPAEESWELGSNFSIGRNTRLLLREWFAITRKGIVMVKLQAFQTVARNVGFVEVSETAEGTVLWLTKTKPDTAREMHQRMCIDSLTNSVTVYWMIFPGKVNSRTFREVTAMQEWLGSAPELVNTR